jgi:hypothetical protein
MTADNFGGTITVSFQNVWAKFINVIPEIVIAILVFLVGVLIAIAIGEIVRKLVSYTQIDKFADKIGITKKFEEIDFNFTISGLVGWLVKWFLVIVFLIASSEILGLDQISVFLRQVALYLPNVIVAVIVLAIGIAVSMFVYDIVLRSVAASKFPSASANALALISKWAIIIFSALIALSQLKIAESLIQILFTGIVIALSLAFGLAFGLGGKEKAARILDKIEKDLSRK